VGDASHGTVAIGGRTVWAVRADTVHFVDRLTAIDLPTGRILGSTVLKDPSADLLTIVGDELWYVHAPQTVGLRP
jgi:hypothetical protein